ncbi:hypothetical protein PPSIR1_40590 [Plesiocystis pacifica SIR-1]|uniref:NAD(P)-binding domain-containing protein n=1 Tax=Plesiocystis pacifica SIR-1 TaxID=391625 RepID=A6FYP8_9BACT|nr:SDR family oxidoreductase [Plesiocystis pacifica]EDM81320.1 hypothetical protein PPSIR1_40590 [Plesiocystis pacifica SIR-1]
MDDATPSLPHVHDSIIVFGATGSVGQLIVRQALARGHDVTAFCRNPARLELDHPKLRTIAGDALDAGAVSRAIAGHDAVLVALGAPLRDRSGLRTHGTQAIVAGMRERGVERLVCLSVMGLGDTWNNLPLAYKAVVIPILLGRVVADHRGQEAVILDSGLNYTIVRPPNLSDEPGTGRPRHGFSGDAGRVSMHVPRADVASFMLDQLAAPTYEHECVAITGS